MPFRDSSIPSAMYPWRFILILVGTLIGCLTAVAQEPGVYTAVPLAARSQSSNRFSLLPSAQTGIRFSNQLERARSLTNQIFLNGSGVTAGDVDGDGWCDLYFCGLDNRNELYRNRGNWSFERITEMAGVACADQASTGAALVDVDGDADRDLIVNGIGRGTRLFLNDGRAKFTEVTEDSGLGHDSGSMSLAIADVNGDGFLDVYVVNYRSTTFRDELEKRFRVVPRAGKYEITMVDGRPTTEPDLVGRFTADPVLGLMEHGEADMLFLNTGGAKFRRVQWNDGMFQELDGGTMTVPYDWGLSAMFRDLNGDLAPDLYVCNDFQSPDRIWLNQGRIKFRPPAPGTFRQTSLFSMGIDFADLDGDGREEIFVADMLSRVHERRQTQVMDGTAASVPNFKIEVRPQVTRNTLFWNRGDGTYAEVAQLAGVEATEWSWCPAFLDVDLDGDQDLIVTTGHERDAQHIDVARQIDTAKNRKAPWRELVEMRGKFPRLDSPVLALENRGALQFKDAGLKWGFESAQVAHGLALADLDNDGDLDLIVNALNSPALVYRNDSTEPRIAVHLSGDAPNTDGIGAHIRVEVQGLPEQSTQIVAGGRYLSSDAFTRTFAMGEGEQASITVRWPGGKITRLTNVASNCRIQIAETSAVPAHVPAKREIVAIFRNVGAQLNHVHRDDPFDDFQRQLLLPRKYSELGPAVCWFDLDGDGWEDLFIGSGRGGKMGVFKNNQGTLTNWHLSLSTNTTPQDQTAIVGVVSGTNRTLLVGFSNYEDGSTNKPVLRQYSARGELVKEYVLGWNASIGPISAADFDGDGDMDLFIGGRVVPGKYPEAPPHILLRNEGGAFADVQALSRGLQHVGMVSAASWSNLDNDRCPELILAVDGGPIRIFSFSETMAQERTREFGLDQHLGWWQSLVTADFNSDGKMDIAAGNIGRNSKYQSLMPDQYVLFHGDLLENGSTQLIEAFRDPKTEKHYPLFDRDSLAVNYPALRERYPTFGAFSMASVEEFLAERFNKSKSLRINMTESVVFFREQDVFRPRPLPLQAQFSPVLGLATGDVTGDGKLDVILSQNLFSVGKGTSRYDAGEGVLLQGLGGGDFRAVPSLESGIKIEGEGRGTAFCDYDHDGRIDLVIGQNSGPTLLYQNQK